MRAVFPYSILEASNFVKKIVRREFSIFIIVFQICIEILS